MLPVYICSSNPNNVVSCKNIVEEYIKTNNIYDIFCACATTEPEELIARLRINNRRSIYFLDLLPGGEWNNISLGLEIRKHDERAYIMIMTKKDTGPAEAAQSMTEPFCARKSDPDIYKWLYHSLDQAYSRETSMLYREKHEKWLHIIVDGLWVAIPQREIYSITTATEPHCVEIHTEYETYIYKYTLEKMLENLDVTFNICHRSYIVNIQHFRDVDRKGKVLILDNGTKVPYSRRLAKKCLKDFNINKF